MKDQAGLFARVPPMPADAHPREALDPPSKITQSPPSCSAPLDAAGVDLDGVLAVLLEVAERMEERDARYRKLLLSAAKAGDTELVHTIVAAWESGEAAATR